MSARIVTTLLSLFAAAAAAAEPLLIENVTLVSPELPQPLGNRHVLIRDGRIATVSASPITAPPGARRLDGSGKFLTPGLTDAHVHVSDAIGLTPGDASLADLEQEFFRQQPRSYLYFGVTQVLDTANRPDRVATFAAQPQHPDIHRCGVAPVVDGYPLVFVDAAIRHEIFNDWIYEPVNAAKHPLPKGANAADHTPEAVVARIAASGAHCVKITLEDGFGEQSDWPIMSADTLKRVRAAATKHKLRVLAHANALDMQRMAVAGNVDMLVHGLWNWNELQMAPGIPPAIDAHLRTIRAKKIGYQATLRVLPGVAELLDPKLLDDPTFAKVVPPRLLAWYRTEPAQWFKNQVFGNNPEAAAGIAQARKADAHWATSEHGKRALRHLYELGHPLLLGSDTPSAPTYGNQPGYETYKEMRTMAEIGIPLRDIFAAGTIDNARSLGLERDYGTIERGKIANLVLLDANPLASIDAWTKIDKVIVRGVAIERESLAADNAPRGVVISDVTVVSPESEKAREHVHVRLVDGKIAELSDRPLRGETEIDGKGRFLVPGLIDSHVHLAVEPGYPSAMNAAQAKANPAVVAVALAQDPRSYLHHGFTTVIDLVGAGERTARWNAREWRPDAYHCGAAIFLKDGQVRRVFYPYFSYDLPFEQRMEPLGAAAQHTPAAVVARIAADGAICVKTIHDVGLEPTVQQIRTLVDASHARKLPLMIHANRKKSQAVAVAAGVDIIVHGMWRNPGEPAPLDAEARALLAQVASDRIGYQPTTQVIAGFADMHVPDYLSRDAVRDVYPAALIELYRQGAAGVPDYIRNAGPPAVEHGRATVGRSVDVTRVLANADARLLFGSDTPSDLIYTNPPGLNARLEMDHWIAAGVTPAKLFRALTIENARALRLEDKIGTVETGKTANLLLMRANPLTGVGAYDTIETVFLHGRPIARAELSARRQAR
jgi:imidazolonepropionase-like amidohydrolase